MDDLPSPEKLTELSLCLTADEEFLFKPKNHLNLLPIEDEDPLEI